MKFLIVLAIVASASAATNFVYTTGVTGTQVVQGPQHVGYTVPLTYSAVNTPVVKSFNTVPVTYTAVNTPVTYTAAVNTPVLTKPVTYTAVNTPVLTKPVTYTAVNTPVTYTAYNTPLTYTGAQVPVVYNTAPVVQTVHKPVEQHGYQINY